MLTDREKNIIESMHYEHVKNDMNWLKSKFLAEKTDYSTYEICKTLEELEKRDIVTRWREGTKSDAWQLVRNDQ